MKTDKLEEFVVSRREEFGPGGPAPDVWDSIKKREPEKPVMKISWQRIAYRAASVVIIFVASYFFHDFMSNRNSGGSEFFAKEDLENPLLRELIEADRYYATQVDLKKEELFSLTTDSPDLQMDINNELEDLDAILLELKQDLKDNADNEEVIEAMMMNYRLKLEILEDMLIQIRNQKNKNNNNEKGYSI